MKFQIGPFDPASIKPFRSHLFVGGSGRGKTHACRFVLSYIAPSIDFCLVFTPTASVISDFQKMVPETQIYTKGADLEVVAKTIAMQRELEALGKQRSILLVFDDCAHDRSFWTSPVCRDLLFSGRHCRITCCFCVQYVLTLPPDCRTNISYIYATGDQVIANRKRLWTSFFGCFRKFEQMESVFQATTQNFSLCVIDSTITEVNSPADCVFYLKAPAKIAPYTIGRQVYWKLHARKDLQKQRQGGVVVVNEQPKQRVLVDAI